MKVIHVIRKPLAGTVAQTALKHGTGGINIDESRIGTKDSLDGGAYAQNGAPRPNPEEWRFKREGGAGEFQQPDGRWPANVILEHLPGCVCLGVQQVKTQWGQATERTTSGRHVYGNSLAKIERPIGYTDENGYEKVQTWDCVEGCPIKMLDGQSGVTTEPFRMTAQNEGRADESLWRLKPTAGTLRGHGDSGGASRFFKQVGGQPIAAGGAGGD